MDSIKILDPDIVYRRKDLIKFLDYWKHILDIQMGWHYDIDLVWILERIEDLGLPKGATIIDAGAGNGLIQFLLAAKGYNVLSVDFSERVIPKEAQRVFKIEKVSSKDIKSHRYQRFISHKRSNFWDKFKKVNLFRPLWTLKKIKKSLTHSLNPDYWKEVRKKDSNYGTITYMQADFTNMHKIATDSIDALVSVSAIEHNTFENIPKALREFERVLKPKASLIVTTSASKDKEHYLDYCQGWCFTSEKLREFFQMDKAEDNYDDYDKIMKKLVENKFIYKRIPDLYFESGDNGLPWGKYPPAYQPVGIVKEIH